MTLFRHITLAAILVLTACQNGEDIPKGETNTPTADMVLRATSDIQTPSPIKAVTFVPNSVASWLGHIILLDARGTLHRATTDSSVTEIVALGKYADVIGVSRVKQSGVFLALTAQGQIKGFIQTDDEGNYAPLAVSQGDASYSRFCASASPRTEIIWAETTSGKAVSLKTEIFEDTSVTLSASEAQSGPNPCEANLTLEIGDGYTLQPDTPSSQLTLNDGKSDFTVDIINGLSIGGVKDAGFVTVTSANMGSVFNEGLLLVADENEGRLVLISRAYALKELEAR